jgi:corrinoid protein of di/trimethylamine methyltransferase
VDCAIKDVHFVSSKDWETVLAAMRIIQEKYGDAELTLETVAEQGYVSKAHLSNAFHRITGKRFSDYLRTVRLDRACELLTKTEKTVESIVAECGLRDVPSFYRNFSTYFHMTPSEYRRSLKRSDDSEEYKKLLKGDKVMGILNDICANVQIGKAKIVKELVQSALDEGVKPAEILSEGLLAGMGEVGEKFKNNEIYVPEVLVAARAMNMGMEILKPHLAEDGVTACGKVCIGTVQGDLHDIGKNLVKMMMEGKGLEVVDLGVDVTPEAFVNAAVEQGCQVICCSALLTTTMDVMRAVVEAAEEAGIRDKVKIMIGGAPVTEEYCRKIGADCYTNDAASAADAAVAFCRA